MLTKILYYTTWYYQINNFNVLLRYFGARGYGHMEKFCPTHFHSFCCFQITTVKYPPKLLWANSLSIISFWKSYIQQKTLWKRTYIFTFKSNILELFPLNIYIRMMLRYNKKDWWIEKENVLRKHNVLVCKTHSIVNGFRNLNISIVISGRIRFFFLF